MNNRYRQFWRGLLPLLCAGLAIVLIAQYVESATITKTNSSPGEADGVVITRDVLFTVADFAVGSQIDFVTVRVDFEKINGESCTSGHEGGQAFNGEIYMWLESPDSTVVPLVNDINDNAIPNGPTTYNNTSYAGPVEVTFNDLASTKAFGLPTTGTYRPEGNLADFIGEDPLGTWTLYIGDALVNDALCFTSFTLQVSASQTPDITDNQSFDVSEGVPVNTEVGTVAVIDNDPGEKLSFEILNSDPAEDFSINSLTGLLRVANALDFETNPVYTLTVRVTDSSALTDTADVIINVLNSDETPVAQNDGPFNIDEDSLQSEILAANGLLANDFDPDGGTLTVDTHDFTSVNGATIIVNANGTYSYDPRNAPALQMLQDTSPTVFDQFDYTIRNNSGLTDTATVFVNVTGVNDAPVTAGDAVTTTEGTPIVIPVLDNDFDIDMNDVFTVTAVGSLDAAITDNNTTVTFTPPDPTSPVVFTYTVEDTRGGQTTDTITVTVTNSAPTLTGITNDGPADEGDTIIVDFTIADNSAGDTYTVTVDWDDGSLVETFNYGTTGSYSVTHTYTDNDADNIYGIGLTVEDSAGGQNEYFSNVGIFNVAPTVSGVGITPGTINEGETITVTGSIADPGIEDTFTVSVNWGDGTTLNYNYPAGATSFEETYVYADDNPTGTSSDTNSIVVTVTDKDNGSDSDNTNFVDVNNVAPSLDSLNLTAGPLDEGATATLSGNITDAGTEDTFTLTVDWGDAVDNYNLPIGAFNVDHVYTEDSAGGTFTVTVSVQDDDTGTFDAGDVGILTVNNVAPQPANMAIAAVDEGGMATLTADIGDPGTADSFTVEIDWGDGNSDTTAYAAGSTTISESHVYADDNPTGTPSDDYTVTLTITDDEAASGNNTTTVTVNNVAPTVDAGTDVLVSIADPTVSFTGVFTDPGTADTHTIVWEFGDGSMDVTNTLSPTHTYPTVAATYVVTLTVTDDDTGSMVDTLMVEVGNTAPIAVNDTDATDEDTVSNVAAPGVLNNDGDPESDPITVIAFDATSMNGATVNVVADGSYTYDPTVAMTLQMLSGGNILVDSFTYTIIDTGGLTSTAVVEVAVTGVNDVPTAVDDTDATTTNVATAIAVLDNDVDIDGDTLTITAVSTPANGTAVIDGETILYTPNSDFIGTDTFTYTVDDGNGASDTANVDVTVSGAVGPYMAYLPLNFYNYVSAPDLTVTVVSAQSDLIEVVIVNQGATTTASAFWVDLYIDPNAVPTHPNEFWQDLSSEGLVWLVDVALNPGDSLTLSYSTDADAPNAFFAPEFSLYNGTLVIGTPIYAQVDSAHVGTTYGAILETHEILGTDYNNISPLATAN